LYKISRVTYFFVQVQIVPCCLFLDEKTQSDATKCGKLPKRHVALFLTVERTHASFSQNSWKSQTLSSGRFGRWARRAQRPHHFQKIVGKSQTLSSGRFGRWAGRAQRTHHFQKIVGKAKHYHPVALDVGRAAHKLRIIL